VSISSGSAGPSPSSQSASEDDGGKKNKELWWFIALSAGTVSVFSPDDGVYGCTSAEINQYCALVRMLIF
jgi:hypothetical protein